jgi:long-chain acyl-CoA synthetase
MSYLVHPTNHARATPHKAAYVIAESGRSVSYQELERRSNQFAHVFRALGLRAGDGIALLMENAVGFFEICWAAQRAGLYYTPISTHLKRDEIGYIVRDCTANVFIASARYRESATDLAGQLPDTTLLLSIGGTIAGYEALEQRADAAPDTPIEHQTAGSSMLYSSGTTGHPKGIRRDLRGETIDACPPRYAAFRERYCFSPDTIYLSPAPLYHAAPPGFTMATMAFGGTCIVMQRFDPEQALSLIERYQVTHSQWVPTMFNRLLRLDENVKTRHDFSTHKIAIHAAAPCRIDTKRRMIDWWGPIVHEYYSGSEGIGTTYISAEQWLAKPGSVGTSVDGSLHIVDDNGVELGVGEIGTVYFANAPRFEYHNAPDKTAAAFLRDDWGTLGDIGYVDGDGYLFLTDRKANMIISGGVNIYPQEAENILLGHAAVIDAAVFGIPNEDYGEEVKAVVQLAHTHVPGTALAAELIDYCRARIATQKCPRSVDFAAQLPRLPNGKLYKRELKARYWPQF